MGRDIAGNAVRPEGEEEGDRQAGEDGVADDGQRGVRISQKMADPKLPSKEEVEEHEKCIFLTATSVGIALARLTSFPI